MNENIYDVWAHEMCDLVDEFAKCHISTDTPMFDFQQSIISHCRRYREAKKNETNKCEHSGIVFNKSGQAVDFK